MSKTPPSADPVPESRSPEAAMLRHASMSAVRCRLHCKCLDKELGSSIVGTQAMCHRQGFGWQQLR